MLASAIVNRGVDLLGMQEMQDDQLAVFQRQLPGYGIWPGRALGNNGVRLQIAYRYDMFDVVDTGSITTVFSHQMRPIPYVLLVNRATGGKFYVVDIHNSPQGQEAERDAATGPEISLVNQLRATGRPVLLMGDTNEHTEFFCRVAAATGMIGYNGASASGGGCNVGQRPHQDRLDHGWWRRRLLRPDRRLRLADPDRHRPRVRARDHDGHPVGAPRRPVGLRRSAPA